MTSSGAFAPYALAGNIVGMVGVGSWMVAELLNTWPFTKEYLRAPNANVSLDDFTGWENDNQKFEEQFLHVEEHFP